MAKSKDEEKSAVSLVSEANQPEAERETEAGSQLQSNSSSEPQSSSPAEPKPGTGGQADSPPEIQPQPPASNMSKAALEELQHPAQIEPIKKPEDDHELVAINVLLLCALAGGMFYVGTSYFGKDSLLFFLGVFVFLFMQPGKFVKGRNKYSRFTKEVSLAFVLSFGLFVLLKAVLPQDLDQAKLLTLILFALGAKLVFFPYYNFKKDD